MKEAEVTPVRVLLVEDEPSDARLVARGIQRDGGGAFSLVHVSSIAEARAAIPAGVDVVLLDLSLPDSFGMATLDRISALLPPSCPILILTGYDDHMTALAAVESGAQDYLIKGQAEGAQLCRAIHHAIRRKQLEERLRLSEERFKAIFTLARDAIVGADPQMRVVLFNRAAEETFGYPAERVLGQPLELLVPDRYRQKFTDGFNAFMASDEQGMGGAKGLGMWALTADGREFIADASIAKITMPDGLIVAATVRDITQQRESEEALLMQAAEMAALAERLDHALAAAEQASSAKSEFLAMMSHEIRTPLNGILGMTRLMLDRPMVPEQREKMEIIHDSGEALLAILDDILDFSKLEAGRIELESADFDVVRVVRSTVALMDSRAAQKGLDLVVAIAPKVAKVVVGDANRLRQVLLNLVGNAVKFTARGYVRVLVDHLYRDDIETRLRFAIEDTGIGIEPEVQKRLFQNFTQADASVARRFGGSGLGLAICKRLVELMGGEIHVESTPGKGSRFWFAIPYRIGEPADALCGPHTPSSPTTVTIPLAPMNLLLAEDNSVNQMVVQGFLEGRGHTVTVVEDGLQAVEACQAVQFDAVLMDMQMPVMDGVEATRFIRSLPPPQGQVPIIALTANTLASDDERCREAGMDDYLRKPVAPDELFLALGRVAERTRRGHGLMEAAGEQPLIDRTTYGMLADAMGHATINRLVGQFVQDVRPRIARTVEACRAGNLGSARQDAHDAKSMSATFGLMALASISEAVEHACRDGHEADALRLSKTLSLCLEQSLGALSALIAESDEADSAFAATLAPVTEGVPAGASPV